MIRSFVLLNVAAIALAPSALAQQRRGPGGGNRLPAVGSILPDVKAYDEAGDEFSTSSLRGSYSVLVFGCLT